MTERSFVLAAEAASGAGFWVFPLRPQSKKPLIAGWQKLATKDAKKLRRLWADCPNANIGVATGEQAGLFVLDVDGEDGRRSLKALEDQHARLPRTFVVRTPRGSHYYFRIDEPVRNSVSKLGPGLDGRGDGGYVVGAGSINDHGERYRYAKGRGPDEIPMAKIPVWLRALLNEPFEEMHSPGSVPPSGRGQAYAAAALRDEADAVRGARKGKRNDQLNRAAFAMGQLIAEGAISSAEVEAALTSAGETAGLELTEIRATLLSGSLAARRIPGKGTGKNQRDQRCAAD